MIATTSTKARWDLQRKVRELGVECCALKTANGTLEMRIQQLKEGLCDLRCKCQESDALAQHARHACFERERASLSMASVLRRYAVLLPRLPNAAPCLVSDFESHVRLLQTSAFGPETH